MGQNFPAHSLSISSVALTPVISSGEPSTKLSRSSRSPVISLMASIAHWYMSAPGRPAILS